MAWNIPEAQFVHTTVPVNGAYLPSGQSEHCETPIDGANDPAEQLVHVVNKKEE
jgi:hypothetical protein